MNDQRFDDGKDDGALRTIGEVARALGIKPHILRYWEQQFKALEPLKRSGGRRYYRPEDIALVDRIDRLVNQEGYTLKGAAAALKDGGGEGDAPATSRTASGEVAEPVSDAAHQGAPASVVARLKAIRSDLAVALAR